MKKLLVYFIAFIISFGVLFTPNYSKSIAAETKVASSSSTENEIDELDTGLGNASKVTINKLKTKEERIASYTEALGGNKTYGTVLYWLNVVRDYSVPVFFVLLVIASLNFFIIGNKKLEKREQGFSMLVTLIIGLIVFQVLPFLFAIIVAGR